jgi:predicted transglutaminase-like cysteine proteinase
MTGHKALKNFCMVLLLWFGLAFTCNTGNNRSTSSSDSDEPTQQRTTQTQTGAGKPYEARDPYTCTDTSKPTSARAIAENFRCNTEEEHMEKLTLVEHIVISEIGSPRQYDHYNDMEAWEIDATEPITPT